jgi:hypothetical protein
VGSAGSFESPAPQPVVTPPASVLPASGALPASPAGLVELPLLLEPLSVFVPDEELLDVDELLPLELLGVELELPPELAPPPGEIGS